MAELDAADSPSILILDSPSAERWNTTVGVKDLPLDSNFAWLLCSLIVVSLWLIHVTFYNSRLLGVLVTSIANKFFGDGHFKVGSCSLSVLSGKLMFRDLAYVTEDISYRVQDGFLIFRWWRVYTPRHISDDMSCLDTRLTATLNGVEVHLYNRSGTYARLERLFGVSQLMKGPSDGEQQEQKDDAVESSYGRWRDLIPVIKADISTGRLVLGNRLVPTTLIISVEEAHCVYSTKPAASQLDPFMHFVKMNAENFKVIMAPSRSYTGRRDDPPRYMGEGFVVLQSTSVEVYGYMDEPGRVPVPPAGTRRLANGDTCPAPPPVCGVHVKCGKGTDFSYGPWADRQRDALFRFFYPASYEPQLETPPPQPGQRRRHEALDIRVTTLADATMDVLFTKNQETSAIHMTMGAGSYLEVNIPWVVGEQGCTTRVAGQMLHLDATTSLTYRNLLECESMEFSVSMEYPIHWNDRSDWTFALTFCKATGYFVYSHKYFLNDLLDDWGSSEPPDLLRFVPCTWVFQLKFRQFELVTLTNQGNWVDCSSQSPENAHLAVCGDLLDLSFDLPFTDYLPETVRFIFKIEAECLELCLHMPEVRSSRAVLLSLASSALVSSRDGGSYTPGLSASSQTTAGTEEKPPASQQPPTTKWRNLCLHSAGWVDCWRVPVLSLNISHMYHPMPPWGPSPQADIPTPDKEAILLSPLRAPSRKLTPRDCRAPMTKEGFCPDDLAPDVVAAELELGASELYLYGALVDNIINFKNNIFGEDELFVDMASARSGTGTGGGTGDCMVERPTAAPPAPASAAPAPGDKAQFDPRKYRPFKVTVALTMHDIRAHLMKSCVPGDPPCPTLTLERVGFELDKTYWETRLQLLLSPVVLLARDTVQRPEPHAHLHNGHLALSGLQFRGHAMFSDRERSLDQDTLEYAWLMEVQTGQLTGRLTAAQLYHTVAAVDTFLQLLTDADAEMMPPAPLQLCHHNADQEICEHTSGDARCPSSDEIKYKMFRFSVDSVDLHLVDCGTSLNLQVSTVRASTCNLYGEHIRQGLTVLLPSVALHNYVATSLAFPAAADNAQPTGDSAAPETPRLWLEAGAVQLGPAIVDLAVSCEQRRSTLHTVQDSFLRFHDDQKRRLWMLWPGSADSDSRCGCVGGCEFFGRNNNGPRFFHPAPEDCADGANTAIYRVSECADELGYGQSLLQPSALMFGPSALSPPPLQPCWQKPDIMIVPTPPCHVAAPANGVSGGTEPEAAQTSAAEKRPNGVDEVDTEPGPQVASSLSGTPSVPPRGDCGASASATVAGTAPAPAVTPRSSVSLQVLPSVGAGSVGATGAPSQLHRRGSRHSLSSATPAGGAAVPRRGAESPPASAALYGAGGPLRHVSSLTSETSQFSELFFSAASDGGAASPLPTFQTPPSTLYRTVNADETAARAQAAEPAPRSGDGLRQVSLDRLQRSASAASSLSSASFLSAASILGSMSGDTPPPADLNMVDLAAQMDRPITDSPLLMASYVHHLQQVECHCWNRPAPSPAGGLCLQPQVRRPDGTGVFSGRLFSPAFRARRQGMSSIRLVPPPPEQMAFRRPPEPTAGPEPLWERWEDERGEEAGLVGSHSQRAAANTTLIVRLRGEAHVAVTPILLESLTRLCTTLEPALARVHPETVLGRHRRSTVSAAVAANQLKRERHLRRRVSSRSSSPRRQTVLLQRTSHHQLQAFVFMPKTNITLLQTAVTEQSISFSALDDVRDLAAVSLAAVSVQTASLRLLRQRRQQRSLHLLTARQQQQQQQSHTHTHKLGGKKKHKSPQVTYEPNVAETVDVDYVETVISVELGRTHCQLRRLKNDSQLLRHAVITAIPANQGNVCFTYAGVPVPAGVSSETEFGAPTVDGEALMTTGAEEALGFNMLEVGVEQLELRTVLKRGANSDGVQSAAAGGAAAAGVPSSGAGLNSGATSGPATSSAPAASASTGASIGRHDPEPEAAPRSPQPPQSAASRTDESTGGGSEAGRERTTALHLELRAVWFNCAAPPKTAVMRKTDYTRCDWNMLSTLSPGIDGWLNAASRLTAALTLASAAHTRRQLAIMACLMTDALDLPSIHATPKSKYGSVVTWVAQSVQEDPSCQLCSVLARYIQLTPLPQLETQLRQRFLPDTTTLKQGVLVLSRQWKNVLWMPVLVGHRFKDTGPPMVPTHVQPTPSRCASGDTAAGDGGGDAGAEKASRLHIPLQLHSKGLASPAGSGAGSPSAPVLDPSLRTRRSLLLPMLSQPELTPMSVSAPAPNQRTRQDSVSSRPSLASGTGTRISRRNSLNKMPTDDSCEDLYNWMARQQNYHASRLPLSDLRDLTLDSEQQPLLEASSDEEDAESLLPPASGLQVLEAHQVFEPLLASAGVLSEVLGGESILQQLGNSVTLVAALQTLRIDIQQSGDHARTQRRVRKQVQLSDEPAFCLTGARAELDLRHVADTAVGDWIQRQPHAFVTRRQLKRHTQAVVNFTVCADILSLKVNMPLLRLLTQLGSVYWNAREVQHGLKAERARRVRSKRTRHRKHGSSSGSEAMPFLRSPEPPYDPLAAPLSAGGGSGSSCGSLFRFPPASAPGKQLDPTPATAGGGGGGGESPSLGRPETPRCWRTVYYLLKLYAIVPETKTVRNSCRLTTIQEQSPEHFRGGGLGGAISGKYHQLRDTSAEPSPQERDHPTITSATSHEPPPAPPPTARKSTDHRLSGRELTPLVVFGVAKVHRTLVEAGVSGLRLEAETREVHASLSGRRLSRAGRRGQQTSLTGHLGGVTLALHEQLQRQSQTVVSMGVGKSQCLYSTEAAARPGARQKNSALLTVGNITIDIPQHPVALHGMVTRSSAHLSNTLKELRNSRSSRLVRTSTFSIEPLDTPQSQPGTCGTPGALAGGAVPSAATYRTVGAAAGGGGAAADAAGRRQPLLQPLAVHFSVVLQSISLTAALLPSLQAQYKMDTVTSMGVTGSKAKFTIDLARHDLSFRTKIQDQNLPSSASVALPQVHISADYMSSEEGGEAAPVPDGAEVCAGGYFSTEAEIGSLEHTLSTDLLNHLVFVQKVFMMEVNEVVQKMAGHGDKFQRPPMSSDEDAGGTADASLLTPLAPGKGPILYSLRLTFRGIQITATTPTNYAVRLETGLTELRFSNRYTRVGTAAAGAGAISRLYGHAELRLNVSLGQVIRNVVFEEADAEFHQYAYFKTNIVLSNAFHDGRVAAPLAADRLDKEVVLIALRRPLVYVQPMAVDKAILVWLNYRNAYDYWSEQRRTLNKEVLTATQQVLDKVPHISQMNVTPSRSTLFLQLTVDDLGICLPINTHADGGGSAMITDTHSRDALVITLEETTVSAMTCDSLICKGRFTGFCLRFAPDFETSLDDWKPDTMDPGIMNLCVVSEGTYEVCSRTTGINLSSEDARWVLNVSWQMEGVDIDLDINIGRHLSALANTLTTFTNVDVDGDGDADGTEADDQTDGAVAPATPAASGRQLTRRRTVSSVDATSSDSLLEGDPRKRAKVLEHRMNEQARVVHELMSTGASSKVLEEETRKLEAFESVVFKDFRRDMLKRLRRQSVRGPQALGNKLSVGSAPGSGGALARAAGHALVPPGGRPRRLARSTTAASPHDVGLDLTSSRHTSIDEADEFDEPDVWRRHSRAVDGAASRAGSRLGNQDVARGRAPSTTVEVNDGPFTPSDLDGVELRHQPSSSVLSPSTPKQPPPAEPNIHFELDVKVFVNSGRCALHTRDPTHVRTEPEDLYRDSRRRGRQHSGFSDESGSSSAGGRRRGGPLFSSGSQTRLMKKTPATLPMSGTSIADITVVQIPGLDVKLHYDSRMVGDVVTSLSTPAARPGSAPSATIAAGDLSPAAAPRRSVSPVPSRLPGEGGPPAGAAAQAGRRALMQKRASLFVWLTLQSIPTETVVSPHVLDFLDQLFELLPMSRGLSAVPPSPDAPSAAGEDVAVAAAAAVASGAGSFPVDVIVFFHMQPSTFRFSCLPVSKVECLLRLPSLDLVFSSKRAAAPTPELLTEPSSAHRRRGASAGTSSPRGAPPAAPTSPRGSASAAAAASALDTPAGGLSVTGVLADFSLFVFHPYGNKYTKDHATSPLNDQDRRDSLSVSVERVQFVVHRSRKLDLESSSGGGAEAGASRAIVRFSTVVDLGSASFKYDMRRLTEILAFPKAWYRRAIVRRLFLGDLGDTTIPAEAESSPTSSTPQPATVAAASASGGSQPQTAAVSATPTRPATLSATPTRPATLSASAPATDVRPRPSRLHVLQRRLSLDPTLPGGGVGTGAASVAVPSSWETLVLFAVNFTKLNVHMNMGNVMGNVMWQTNGFTSEGRLSIGSTGHKNMLVTLGLGGSSLEAKGGIVGGNVDVGKIDTYLRILEDPGVEPQHTLGLRLQTVEMRLDYMGTSVLMGRVSALDATLRDEWRIHPQSDAPPGGAASNAGSTGAEGTNRPATIFLHSEVSWDQLQLMISKSTTTDLLKMAAKLDEFFLQQFQSSKRVLIGLGETGGRTAGTGSAKPGSLRARPHRQRRLADVLLDSARDQADDTRHHRHWHDALRMVAGLKLNTFSRRLPESGSVLGGTMEMRGNTISLACFHGLNFKAKSWALFSMRQPCISFSTESQEIDNGVPPDVHVVETLSISLGLLTHQSTTKHVSMATVCRVTRTILFPPQFRTMQEWFHYTFSTSELDEVHRFPTLERGEAAAGSGSGSGERRSSRAGQASPPPRLHDHQHTAEIVFALPPMQMHLKTEHTQTGAEPDMSAPKPVVVCSFVTEFEDHIFVTTDAENFFFLHDLIETYITRQPESADRPRATPTAGPAHRTSRLEAMSGTPTTSTLAGASGAASCRSADAGAASGGSAAADSEGAQVNVNEPTQQLQRDWRDFQCRTWHLEPTVRLLSWAGRRIEPYGVDFILNKLGFRHARTTIPKWLQRGAMDPLDLVLAVLVQKVITATREGH